MMEIKQHDFDVKVYS